MFLTHEINLKLFAKQINKSIKERFMKVTITNPSAVPGNSNLIFFFNHEKTIFEMFGVDMRRLL